MNWLFWVVAVFLGYHIVDGFRRGFIRKSVSVLSLILSLVLVTYLTPQVTSFIKDHTSIYQNLQETCSELFLDEEYDENVKTDQVQMVEKMNLPDNVKNMLLENNNTESYELLSVTAFSDYVGAYLANMIIDTLTYLIVFVLIFVILRLILLALDVVAMLPILHGINKLAGGVLGIAESIVLVWIAFLLVTVFCGGTIGQEFFSLICENQFLLFLYEQNVIMKIVFGMIF